MSERTPQTVVLYAAQTACLDVDAFVDATGLPRAKISKALARLIERGLMERREQGCFAATLTGLQMVAEQAEVSRGAPKQDKPRRPIRGTLRQRAWNVMRIQSPFSVRSVAMVAVKSEVNAESDLRKWFRALELAGYLQRQVRREAGTAPSSNGFVRYSLIRSTGMIAPIWSIERGCVRDLNLGKDFPCQK